MTRLMGWAGLLATAVMLAGIGVFGAGSAVLVILAALR